MRYAHPQRNNLLDHMIPSLRERTNIQLAVMKQTQSYDPD